MECEMGREWKARQEKMKRKLKSLQEKFLPWKAPAPSQINGIKISDEELAEDEAKENPRKVQVYGGAIVPGAAIPALTLDPKLALFPRIEMKGDRKGNLESKVGLPEQGVEKRAGVDRAGGGD